MTVYKDMGMVCFDVCRAVLVLGFQDSADQRGKMARG